MHVKFELDGAIDLKETACESVDRLQLALGVVESEILQTQKQAFTFYKAHYFLSS